MALKKAGRKPKVSLIKELDAAIALLTRVRSLAVAATESDERKQQPGQEEGFKATEASFEPRRARGNCSSATEALGKD
jgi:hypothetical protein